MHTKFRWGNLKQREQLEDLGAEEVIMLKYIVIEEDGAARIGFISHGTKERRSVI